MKAVSATHKRKPQFKAKLRLTPEFIARCKSARESGMSYQQVAAACGCSLSTAWKACKE